MSKSLRNAASALKLRPALAWLAALACLPGGALWAVSPLGIVLSEQRLTQGSDAFWMLFSAAPLALAVGLIGLYLLGSLSSGRVALACAAVTLFGLALVVAGNVGQFWLGLDDTFTVLAPAYRAFRTGLVVLAVGSALIGVVGAVRGSLPLWGALPFVLAALCGAVGFVWDLGTTGSALWAVFGSGWIWLGSSVLLSALAGLVTRRRRPRPA